METKSFTLIYGDAVARAIVLKNVFGELTGKGSGCVGIMAANGGKRWWWHSRKVRRR